ncbi:MAG: zinc finger domain-containing protein [Candidatus Nanohaloarchaea archaeon]
MENEECTSCGRNLKAAETFVEFGCPECGETISRCGKCKKLAREYECPECGFTGP